MLHTKFRGNQSTGSGEDFLKCCNINVPCVIGSTGMLSQDKSLSRRPA